MSLIGKTIRFENNGATRKKLQGVVMDEWVSHTNGRTYLVKVEKEVYETVSYLIDEIVD
jgi:hypothetical protein